MLIRTATAMGDRLELNGGERLITVGEAAEILKVSEAAVIEWIESGRIRAVSTPNGSYRLRLWIERHHHSGALASNIYALDLGLSEPSEESEEWRRELFGKQRERSSAGLIPGSLKLEAFTRALAERFAAVIPAPMWVSVQDGMVWLISAFGGRAGLARVDGLRDGDDPVEVVRGAVEGALATAQDYVSEDTGEPWPAVAGQLSAGFPAPRAEIADGQLRMFYGNPDAPMLELTPIPLAEILEPQRQR
jgi:excisionase family DNA binding protein